MLNEPIDIFVLTRGHFLALLAAVFAVAFACQILFRLRKIKTARVFRLLFWISAAFPFLYYVYLTYAQYLEWKGESGPGRFLVPPYLGIGYVIRYHFIGFYMYYLVSLFVALFFLLAAVRLNKKFGERFFESEEPYLGALAINLTGTPGFAIYLIVLFAFQLLMTIGRWVVFRRNERVPFYYLWLPAGLFAILLMRVLHLFYFA
ncbi:MAG: hypothetical protein M1153_00715 [Patescibacteria group bacterium]|nr:hypothetical protein [Patescibacteria group bacterium]